MSKQSESSWKMLRCVLVVVLSYATIAVASDEFDDSDMQRRRVAAKPWYTDDTTILGYTIPISPVTFVISFVALWQLIKGFTSASTAEACHILIKERSPASRKLLENMKKDIGNDINKFHKFAKEYSACPSKDQGGYLGQWKKGCMDPNFDAAVFNPSNPINSTIGPVETSFGFHLIYIQKRKIV